MTRLLFIALLFFPLFAGAQNLVPNPSFEVHDTCPTQAGQICLAVPWFQTYIWFGQPCGGSSDFYHECGSVDFSVPYHNYGMGYQHARTGLGYAGIAFYGGNSTREYLECKLLLPLQAGKRYCIEYFVNLHDNSRQGTDVFEVYISHDTVRNNIDTLPVTLLPYEAQISNVNGIITDTVNWVKISGMYIAQGGEQFITIGSFKDDPSTNTAIIGGPNEYSYYYIDDVSVIMCDTVVVPPTPPKETFVKVPNVFTPNGDGVNDQFEIEVSNIETITCTVYNRWGISVGTSESSSPGNLFRAWNGHTTSGLPASEGVYFYVVNAVDGNGEPHTRTGAVQLLR